MIKLEAYPIDEMLCVVKLLKEYLTRTASLRGKQLFISYVKPFSPVSHDAISRWVKTIMQIASIDTVKFKPHSTRAASTSAAQRNAVPLEKKKLTAAAWKSDCVFAKYYNKSVECKSFSEGVLT